MAQPQPPQSPVGPGGGGQPHSPGAPGSPQSSGAAGHAGSPAAQGPSTLPGQALAGPLPRASFGQRLGAFAIDLVIIVVAELIVGFIFGIILTALFNTGSGAGAGLAALIGLITLLLYIAIPVVYFGYLEGQPSGQTFGKKALNIRVVDFNNAGSIGIGRGMLRSVVRSLISGIFLLGYLWMLWDPQQQTWHDKLVQTTVVPTSAYPV